MGLIFTPNECEFPIDQNQEIAIPNNLWITIQKPAVRQLVNRQGHYRQNRLLRIWGAPQSLRQDQQGEVHLEEIQPNPYPVFIPAVTRRGY
jgi:hypothetical protein